MDQTSKFSEYKFSKEAFWRQYQLGANKDIILSYEFIKNWYNSFESKPFKYSFLWNIMSKLN